MPIFKTIHSAAKAAFNNPAADGQRPLNTQADTKLKTSAVASNGATKTALPSLLADWKLATREATAVDMARKDLSPELQAVITAAEKKQGRALNVEELRERAGEFFERHQGRVTSLAKKHLGTLASSGAQLDAVAKQAVDTLRPHLTPFDPFTPIAQGNRQARAREVVLWENREAMVLVDLFVEEPKALVVPKQTVSFPTDASPQLLNELARVSAHVSDAFMSSAGAKKPAGIWINAPQDLTVRQMHVHVMPDLAPWSKLTKTRGMTGANAVELMSNDAAARKQMDATFQNISAALVKTLGPSQ